MVESVDNFYDKVFGKESALFIGTLWLGMIAKQMDEVRKAEDEAYEFMGEFVFKWLNKLITLYDNVEFKTDITRYKDDKEFETLQFDKHNNRYDKVIIKVPHYQYFIKWFEKIQLMIEQSWRISDTSENKKIKFYKERNILYELGKCQREFYKEIEKKHLIMPPERESMKDLVKSEWVDREKRL